MNVANNNKLMNIIDMHVEKYAPVTEAGSSTGEKNYYPGADSCRTDRAVK